MEKKYKYIIIGALSIIALVLLIIGIKLLFFKEKIIENNELFSLVDELEAEVYSKVKISDYIKNLDGKVIEDKQIDTEELGEQEITFLYYYKDNQKQKYKGNFKIQVKDKEEPLIWLSKSYKAKVGSEINLPEEIMCVDNYDPNPLCQIEGAYDLNTAGDYPLTFVATDNSKNISKVDFTLHVYEPAPANPSTSQAPAINEGTSFNEIVTKYKTPDNEIGLDVSKWQGEIDFNKVKEAGATFVMIRIGSQKGVGGEYNIDPYFEKNIQEATKVGLKVGVYFFSYADSTKEAKKQAEWVVKQLKKEKLALPVVFDWECYAQLNGMELSLFGLNKVAESFLDTVEKKGYDAMLYGSKNYLNAIWKYHSYNVWLAHYTEQTDYASEYVMWQLCDDGVIDGIEGFVDVDILYKSP